MYISLHQPISKISRNALYLKCFASGLFDSTSDLGYLLDKNRVDFYQYNKTDFCLN